MIAADVATTLKSKAGQRRLGHATRWTTLGAMGVCCGLLLSNEVRAEDAMDDVAPVPLAATEASPPASSPALDLASPVGLAGPAVRTFNPRFSVTSAPVPMLDASEGTPRRVRIDLTGWTHSAEVAGLGLSLGSSVAQQSHVLIPLAPGATSSAMDLALRWRSAPLGDSRRVDVAAWRRVTPDAAELARAGDGQPVYGARVEMQMSSIRSSRRLVPELGAIGFQFDGGAKLSLRAKGGKPMLYYRSSF